MKLEKRDTDIQYSLPYGPFIKLAKKLLKTNRTSICCCVIGRDNFPVLIICEGKYKSWLAHHICNSSPTYFTNDKIC